MPTINTIMNFSPFASYDGSVDDLAQLLESEMEATWKKVDELKNRKKKTKTLEEQAKDIKKKFKKSMNLSVL